MSPILGIWASQNYPRITSSYESIATVTVGAGGQSTITFSSIPSTYKHLQIRAISKTSTATGSIAMQFNGDTAANYSMHYLLGSGSAASSSGQANRLNMLISSTTATGSVFPANVTDILEYSNTNIYKTIRSLEGFDTNGGGEIVLFSGNWRNTAAVSSITIFESAGASFTQYTSFALYGIKG